MTGLTKYRRNEERNFIQIDVFWENTVEEGEQWLELDNCKTTASACPTNKNNGHL